MEQTSSAILYVKNFSPQIAQLLDDEVNQAHLSDWRPGAIGNSTVIVNYPPDSLSIPELCQHLNEFKAHARIICC